MTEHERIREMLDRMTIPELIALTPDPCNSCHLDDEDDCPGMEFCENIQVEGDISPVKARTELERRHKLLHVYIEDCRGAGSKKDIFASIV